MLLAAGAVGDRLGQRVPGWVPRGFKIKKQPEDGAVVIVQRRRVSQYVKNLPRRLNKRGVEAIYEVAHRSTTWRCRLGD